MAVWVAAVRATWALTAACELVAATSTRKTPSITAHIAARSGRKPSRSWGRRAGRLPAPAGVQERSAPRPWIVTVRRPGTPAWAGARATARVASARGAVEARPRGVVARSAVAGARSGVARARPRGGRSRSPFVRVRSRGVRSRSPFVRARPRGARSWSPFVRARSRGERSRTAGAARTGRGARPRSTGRAGTNSSVS
jgi:hypothetical protein